MVKERHQVMLENWGLGKRGDSASRRLGGLKNALRWTGMSRKNFCWS
jgi:hypothetical protein